MHTDRTRLGAGFVLAVFMSLASCGGELGREVTDEQVRSAVSDRVREGGGAIAITDPRTGTPVTATLQRMHEDVDQTEGGRYRVCADFRADDGTTYDVDFYLAPAGDRLALRDTVVHEADGESVISEAERTRLDTATAGGRGGR